MLRLKPNLLCEWSAAWSVVQCPADMSEACWQTTDTAVQTPSPARRDHTEEWDWHQTDSVWTLPCVYQQTRRLTHNYSTDHCVYQHTHADSQQLLDRSWYKSCSKVPTQPATQCTVDKRRWWRPRHGSVVMDWSQSPAPASTWMNDIPPQYLHQPPRPTQPPILSGTGNEYQPKGWE